MLGAFAQIGHPFLANWRFYDTRRNETLLVSALTRGRLVQLIGEGVSRDETDGEPFPQLGYRWMAGTEERRSPRTVSLHLKAGDSATASYRHNMVDLWTEPLAPENLSLIKFSVMKPVLLGIVAAWNPAWVELSPWSYWERWKRAEPWDDDDRKVARRDGYVPRVTSGRMTYLCADYARRITPPPGIDAEPVAGGGILLVATQEAFTPGNAAHDAAADAIQNALLPLQNLPRPPTDDQTA